MSKNAFDTFRMRQIDCDFVFKRLAITTKRGFVTILSEGTTRIRKASLFYKISGELTDSDCELIFSDLPLRRKRQIIWMVAEIAALIYRFRRELRPFENLQMDIKRRLISIICFFPGIFKNKISAVASPNMADDDCDETWKDLKPKAKSAVNRILRDVFKEIRADNDLYIVLIVAKSCRTKRPSHETKQMNK